MHRGRVYFSQLVAIAMVSAALISAALAHQGFAAISAHHDVPRHRKSQTPRPLAPQRVLR